MNHSHRGSLEPTCVQIAKKCCDSFGSRLPPHDTKNRGKGEMNHGHKEGVFSGVSSSPLPSFHDTYGGSNVNRQTIVKLVLCVNLPPIIVTGKTHDKTALVKFRVESPKKDAQFSVESKDAQFSKVKSSEDMEDRLLGFPHDTIKRDLSYD